MIPRERLTCQNREGEGTEINLHVAIVCLANTVHWLDGNSDWCGFWMFNC